MRLLRCSLLLAVAVAAGGCRDLDPTPTGPDARRADAGGPDARRPIDALVDPTDGTPARRACTSNFGSALTAQYGRLDGRLVAIGCNPDNDHLRLQIEMNGATYDVSINVSEDVVRIARDAPVSVVPWSEGWHPGTGVNYPALGMHDEDFQATTTPQLFALLADELDAVNHISVYGTGYDVDGAHLVHRTNGGNDGGLVLRPLSATPRFHGFAFDNQSF